LNVDTCTECDKPSVKAHLITGDDLEFWCIDHLVDAQDIAKNQLGEETFNFIFSSLEHDIWFFGIDIQTALSCTIIDYFTELARGLYRTEMDELVHDNAELVKIKSKEYAGTIEFSEQENKIIMDMLNVWINRNYVQNIGEPLGKDTYKIVDNYYNEPMSPETFRHLICMILAAKRAEGYANHEFAEHLIQMEKALWETHRQNIIN